VTGEGIRIVGDFLKKWSSLAGNHTDGEDIVMADAELSPETQLEELKTCFAEIQSQSETNAWIQSLLASL
jgi:DNA mismatch repair protein MSH2